MRESEFHGKITTKSFRGFTGARHLWFRKSRVVSCKKDYRGSQRYDFFGCTQDDKGTGFRVCDTASALVKEKSYKTVRLFFNF